MLICYDQPQLIPPLKPEICRGRPSTRSSNHPSHWLAEGRDLASRASSRASFSVRRNRSRRPTIGNPSDFRKTDTYTRRREQFRPLELSIYLPGNRLSPLPLFSEPFNDGLAELEYPRNALIRGRSDSLLYRPSTSFSIPRKPVGSIRELSPTGDFRSSLEDRAVRSSMSIHSRSQSLRLGSSSLDSESTKEFLAALDARLPQSPSPLRNRSSTEPGFTLHRRASEQNIRLRIHLEERQEIERRLKDIDTIVEEKPHSPQETEVEQGHNTLEPVTTSTPECGLSKVETDTRPYMDRALPRTPLSFNQPNPTKQPAPPPPPPKAIPSAIIPVGSVSAHSLPLESYYPQKSSARTRVSQWLFRMTPDWSNTPAHVATPLGGPFYQCSTPYSKPRAATDSTMSSVPPPLDDSSTSTVTTASSPEQLGVTLPPYQACPPYQEFEAKVDKPLRPVSVGVAI